MSFRFDHVGLLTPDMGVALATYRALGCELSERASRRGEFDIAFMAAGSDVLLEFQAPPLLAESEEYVARQGFSIERIAVVCDDVQAAYAELIDAGVASAWAPTPFVVDGVTLAVAAGAWSPEGLMIDIVEHKDVRVPRPARAERGDLALHHACCLTSDLAAAEEFWMSRFGLAKVLDFSAPADGGGTKGFVMLADPFFDAAGHEFVLEIIGGEHDSIDGPVWERRGPCFDHLCFTTADVETHWHHAVEAGVEPLSPPAFYPEYDVTIGWLYDADGNHIELMSTLAPELLQDAHRSGVCSNMWVDDWRRDPEVLARRGGLAVQVRR